MYGMRLSELTEDILKEIFLIYDRVVGGRVEHIISSRLALSERLRFMCSALSGGCGGIDLRYGSRLKGKYGIEDEDAKLCIWDEGLAEEKDRIIRFSFDLNIVHGEEAEKMMKDFEKAVDDFLLSKGIAIKLNK